jgi:hypothetical protein
MKQTMPLGRVAGIRIDAHWSVLAMVLLIGWLLGAQVLPTMTPHQPASTYWAVAIPGAVAFIAALLAHELAHLLVTRRCGVPVTSITLWALGGVSELGGEPPTARADLLIAAAGPVTSLAVGVVFGGVAVAVRAGGGPIIAVAGFGWLAVMNVFLAIFNLLPGAAGRWPDPPRCPVDAPRRPRTSRPLGGCGGPRARRGDYCGRLRRGSDLGGRRRAVAGSDRHVHHERGYRGGRGGDCGRRACRAAGS